MKSFLAVIILVALAFALASYATDDHSKASTETTTNDHEHSDAEEHNHDEEEEGGSSVGPNKGITEANERNGFKLSPEATKNFDLKLMKLIGDGPWMLPKSALVHSGEEVNLFRLRSGFFKRIDFETLRKSDSKLTVDSDDMRAGDEIVLVGMGFLRVAELAAFGGVAHGHSH